MLAFLKEGITPWRDPGWSEMRLRRINLTLNDATIGPQFAEGIFGRLGQLDEHESGTIAILNARHMHYHLDEAAQGINDDMALAAFDLLAGIVADVTADFGGLDTLTIADCGTRFRCAALPLAFFPAQRIVDLRPELILAPFTKVIENIVI